MRKLAAEVAPVSELSRMLDLERAERGGAASGEAYAELLRAHRRAKSVAGVQAALVAAAAEGVALKAGVEEDARAWLEKHGAAATAAV